MLNISRSSLCHLSGPLNLSEIERKSVLNSEQ